jgi:hypothetical protein
MTNYSADELLRLFIVVMIFNLLTFTSTFIVKRHELYGYVRYISFYLLLLFIIYIHILHRQTEM